MKKTFALLAIIATFSLVNTAYAEEKIASVSVQEIVKKSVAAKSVQKQAEKIRSNLQDSVTKKEDELRKEERELAKQRSIISKDAFEERTKAFQKKMVDAQKNLQARGAKLQRGYENAMTKIKERMLEVIAEVAKDEDITLVVPRSNLLFINESADISAKVIEELNDSLEDVKLEAK